MEESKPFSMSNILAFGGLALLIIGILTALIFTSKNNTQVEIIPAEEVSQDLVVDVSGAVQNPGVYKLKAGSRFGDALMSAGGLSAQADREWVDKTINLAAPLKDGIKIYIKDKNNNTVNESSSGKININTADQAQLEKLAGVGPVTAKRILDYRESSGMFTDPADIQKVSGIGPSLYEKIKEEITVY